jgi:hypothetical protein
MPEESDTLLAETPEQQRRAGSPTVLQRAGSAPSPLPELPGVPARQRRPWPKIFGLGVLIALLLYYPIGMLLMHRIGDDTGFASSMALRPGQSRAVATLAALIDREINTYRWTPHDPFFVPTAALDNLPNFQRGMQVGAALLIAEFRDRLARTPGSSAVDLDLQEAASRITTSAGQWNWNPRVELWPRSQAERHYDETIRRLRSYNVRLSEEGAVFDRRADNLQAVIDRINGDLGSHSAVIAARIEQHGDAFFDSRSDDIFYQAKGRVYVFFLVLRALGADFETLLAERQLTGAWHQMLGSLEAAARLRPLIVRNGKADSMLMPSHLAAQGFFLLRARAQLKEISEILLR